MDDLNILLLISRWLHIGAAIIAIGGTFFMRFGLVRQGNSSMDAGDADQRLGAISPRWPMVVHICIAILFITGGLNFWMLAIPPKIEPLPYHPIFGVKLMAALAVFFVAEALVGRSPAFAKMRAVRKRWLNIALGLAALIVLLSGMLYQIRLGPPVRVEVSALQTAK